MQQKYIVPASITESFFSEYWYKGEKPLKVTTKAYLITSTEHLKWKAYNNRIKKNQIRARSKGKLEERDKERLERGHWGKVKTYRGFKRRLNMRGGKVNVGPAKIPRSARNRVLQAQWVKIRLCLDCRLCCILLSFWMLGFLT